MLYVDFIKLTSPGITLLVLLAGFVGMWIGSGGMPEPHLLLWGLLGIGLASSGSSVFNNYHDSDIDRLMQRTLKRPLAAERLRPRSALIFGLALSFTAVGILAIFVNILSAVLAALAIAIYGYLYTVILKRRTPLATEIGGISGALPPLIGWAAVKGDINYEALMLFMIMFLWQPPHFWSFSLKYREDYRKAGIPTMTVVESRRYINFRSYIYVFALVLASFIPCYVGLAGRFYLAVSLILGVIYMFLYAAALLSRRDLNRELFIYSITYLSLVFIAMAVDIEK